MAERGPDLLRLIGCNQPFSQAGQRKGQDDDRHLAPAFLRLVAACRPELVFGEQVASAAVLGPVGRKSRAAVEGPAGWAWFDALAADLEAASYAVAAADLPAAGIGAPHIRQRLFFGAVALGFWLLLWIPRLLASLARSAELIDPGGAAATRLDVIALILALLLGVHGVAAWARGGRLHHMLVPRPRLELAALRRLCTRSGYAQARDLAWEHLASLELDNLARAGVLGLLAGIVWLLVPTTLLALGSLRPALAVVGCVLMAIAVSLLPFIQLRVVQQRRLGALLEVDAVRSAQAAAPLATAGALLLTVASSLPLYLLKIELIPREAMWLPGLAFVTSMLPARLACGWALRRGLARERPRHWALRLLGRLLVIPTVFAYGVVLYFTQYLSWYGTWSLYEQHAFLLPVPFLGG